MSTKVQSISWDCPFKGVWIYLGDNAGLDPRELLVSPLVEQRVGHNVYDDEQLAAPATVTQSKGWSHVIIVDSQLDLKGVIAFFTHYDCSQRDCGTRQILYFNRSDNGPLLVFEFLIFCSWFQQTEAFSTRRKIKQFKSSWFIRIIWNNFLRCHSICWQ